jgi:serine protease Do
MRNTDLFENYLNNELSPEEKAAFESRVEKEEAFAKAFNEHQSLIAALKQHNNSIQLKKQLKEIHQNEFGSQARVFSLKGNETFGKRAGRTAMVAASTAIFAVLSTIAILSMGGYFIKQKSDQITELGLKLKATNEGIVEGITRGTMKAAYAPASMEGSAFALNNNGYILTSLHMIKGADSVFVQNNLLGRTNAKVVITDAKLDIAILKIENKEILKNWAVPFNFSGRSTDIGEKVFTLGFPRKDIVYGEGSLSSLSGYDNDTCMYQISIPVNPGNSGGPLCDEQGNIIGVIRGKNTSAEGTGYAVKSKEIINSLHTLGADSILVINKKVSLKGTKRTEQIKKMNPYVFNVLVYKND